MSNQIADQFQFRQRESAMPVSAEFPNVASIQLRVISTLGNRPAVGAEFTYLPTSKSYFKFACPYAKCIGRDSGIDFRAEIKALVSSCKTFGRVREKCGGFGGYNESFGCENFIEAEIRISYLSVAQD